MPLNNITTHKILILISEKLICVSLNLPLLIQKVKIRQNLLDRLR